MSGNAWLDSCQFRVAQPITPRSHELTPATRMQHFACFMQLHCQPALEEMERAVKLSLRPSCERQCLACVSLTPDCPSIMPQSHKIMPTTRQQCHASSMHWHCQPALEEAEQATTDLTLWLTHQLQCLAFSPLAPGCSVITPRSRGLTLARRLQHWASSTHGHCQPVLEEAEQDPGCLQD